MNKYIMLAVSLLAVMCGAAGCRTRAPLMVAHRGAGDLEMPEASLAAYSNAVATACDIVKLDLLETKDVAYLQRQGLWVSLWFVQSAEMAAEYRDAGADAFVTDHVSEARRGLGIPPPSR